ncbi:MAG: DUF5723 family protein [Balneolaceae bacterium]|nr:DUF5723 family protein [Balneolaceae bacterium]
MNGFPAIRAALAALMILAALPALQSDGTSPQAQPAFNARNSALGGGGTAWLTGYEANFLNPANLFLPGGGPTDLGLSGVTFYAESFLARKGLRGFAEHTEQTLRPYRPGAIPLTSDMRRQILRSGYTGGRNTLQAMQRSEVTLLGLRWDGREEAYSVALRARQGLRTVTGRGWYTPSYHDGERDFTLVKQKETLYELSAGFARELTFIDRLWPGVHRLLVGMAPKIVLGGAFADLHYEGRYTGGSETAQSPYDYAYRHRSAGEYTDLYRSYRASGDPANAIDRTLRAYSSLVPSGFGAGLDLGLTYLIPLDRPLPSEGSVYRASRKVLRIGISVTDLGVMRYNVKPLSLRLERASMEGLSARGIASSYFTGSDGQVPEYFQRLAPSPNPLLEPDELHTEEITTSLPTALNTGVMLRLDGLRLMGDLSLGLTDNAFTTRQLTAHLGVEVRPVPALPLRGGAQLAPGRPVHWTLGTGLETNHFELHISARFLSWPGDATPLIAGAGFGGLRLKL